jgi:L-fuconolactonase
MEPLAEHENVACKLSGMMTETDWNAWTPQQLQPYVTRVLDWFGPERCMFGSDWPVSLLASDYARTVSTMKELVGEDDKVFGGAAARVYGLS